MKDRKLFNLLYLLIAASIMFINVGCSKDENVVPPPATVNESEELVKYFEANGDFINTASHFIKAVDLNTAMSLNENLAVLDIRSATDYATGHIQGAVNVAPADLLTYYAANSLASKTKVVIACYTGQTAGFAATILRLKGYTNVFDLQWGMCSWAYPDRWNAARTNGENNVITLQTTSNPKNAAGNLPTLTTGKTTGVEISDVRLAAVLAEGFGVASIDRNTVYANLSNYYIVNYWPEARYLSPGHIEGAVNYVPQNDLKIAQFLKTLPTNKTIVVYCYTGHGSSIIAPYLRALGYDAKSLLYGANNLFYNANPGTKWVDTECKNYPVVQ
ncbi:MAG: rhodanese-like domain-containing protein [Ignavibacteriota bacterium]